MVTEYISLRLKIVTKNTLSTETGNASSTITQSVWRIFWFGICDLWNYIRKEENNDMEKQSTTCVIFKLQKSCKILCFEQWKFYDHVACDAKHSHT